MSLDSSLVSKNKRTLSSHSATSLEILVLWSSQQAFNLITLPDEASIHHPHIRQLLHQLYQPDISIRPT